MSNATEKLAARIRKLLALSESPNEHEAMAAASKARALLLEHRLSLSDVQEKAEEFETYITPPSPSGDYRAIIFRASALFNMCEAATISVDDKTNRYILFGRKIHIYVTQEVANYLIVAVERMALREEETLSNPYLSLCGGSYESRRNAFLTAAACKLDQRLRAMAAEGKVKASDGRMLPVPVELGRAVTEAFQKKYAANLVTEQLAPLNNGDLFAASLGLSVAEEIPLNKQVRQHKAAPALKD